MRPLRDRRSDPFRHETPPVVRRLILAVRHRAARLPPRIEYPRSRRAAADLMARIVALPHDAASL